MAIYDRDYLTTLPLLYDKAFEYSWGDWNKYNDDIGDTILKLIASSSHSVDYYFRKFLASLILPNDDWDQKSLIWELTGYKPNYLRADYLMVQLYWPDCGLNSYIPIYQYTPFKIMADGQEYIFLSAQDYIIPPLTTRFNVRLVNGTLETIDQDYTQVPNDNKIKLSDEDIDYDLVTLIISGIKWTQVRNVFYSPDTERIFSVHKESDGTYLYLHKTWREYVDSYDTSFKIYYVKSYYNFQLFTDECMTVEFNTSLLTIDGDDVTEYYKITPLLNSDEALDASNLLPSTTEGNRAITTLDFESNAALFPGIASCRSYDWNNSDVCKTPFEVCVIACDEKGNLSDHMQQVLKAYLESISSPLINVRIIPPKFAKQDILVVLDIGDYKGTLAEIELKRVVNNALEEFYAIGNLPPGRVVNTKELNSLLLHADSRIYFATTSFLNAPVHSPLLIPILGNVVAITSADAFSYYDFGKGSDQGFIDPHPIDLGESFDRYTDIGHLLRFMKKVNMIAPIDKIPLQSFESAKSKEEHPLFHIGAGEFSPADFGYGEGFTFAYKTGGSVDGPEFILIFETNGTSVLAQLSHTIETNVASELKFVNSQAGTQYMDPGIRFILIRDDDIDQIKDALAQQFNMIPYLVDENNQPFNITGSDINYTPPLIPGGDTPLMGSGNVISRENYTPDNFTKLTRKTPLNGSQGAHTTSSDESQEERTYTYLPYDKTVLKGFIDSDVPLNALENNFVINEFDVMTIKSYFNFNYSHYARYTPLETFYGDMTFTANTTLHIKNHTKEFIPQGSDVLSMTNKYSSAYYVREKQGNPLNWYLINTSPIQTVGGTYPIGYGIMVGFNLLRDSAIYVETDVDTSRGFIYSPDLQIQDFYLIEV